MTSIQKLQDEAIKNNHQNEVKMFNLIEALGLTTLNERVNAKNSTIEYWGLFNDDTWGLVYQPFRRELKIDYDGFNVLEVYNSKSQFKLCTRGYYLTKMSFNKKEQNFLDLLKLKIEYKPKWDMKHKLDGLTTNEVVRLIKKFYKLNYNLCSYELVNEGEDLTSVKSIYIKQYQEEGEE